MPSEARRAHDDLIRARFLFLLSVVARENIRRAPSFPALKPFPSTTCSVPSPFLLDGVRNRPQNALISENLGEIPNFGRSAIAGVGARPDFGEIVAATIAFFFCHHCTSPCCFQPPPPTGASRWGASMYTADCYDAVGVGQRCSFLPRHFRLCHAAMAAVALLPQMAAASKPTLTL